MTAHAGHGQCVSPGCKFAKCIVCAELCCTSVCGVSTPRHSSV